MKRFAIMLLALLLLTGCAAEPTVVDLGGKVVSYDTVEEMIEASDIIIRAVRLPNAETRLEVIDGQVLSALTLSRVEITEVLSDPADALRPGDVIHIVEQAAYDEDGNTLYTLGGYELMEESREYILFLSDANMGSTTVYYQAAGLNCGTVSLEADGRTPKPVWEQALELYGD